MNTIANARNSSAIRNMQQAVPVLRASSLGDVAFVDFLTRQARSNAGAPLVVSELEKKIAYGYRLDSILWQVLATARFTVSRHPDISAVFH